MKRMSLIHRGVPEWGQLARIYGQMVCTVLLSSHRIHPTPGLGIRFALQGWDVLVLNEDGMRNPGEVLGTSSLSWSLEPDTTATRDDPPSGRWSALTPRTELDEDWHHRAGSPAEVSGSQARPIPRRDDRAGRVRTWADSDRGGSVGPDVRAAKVDPGMPASWSASCGVILFAGAAVRAQGGGRSGSRFVPGLQRGGRAQAPHRGDAGAGPPVVRGDRDLSAGHRPVRRQGREAARRMSRGRHLGRFPAVRQRSTVLPPMSRPVAAGGPGDLPQPRRCDWPSAGSARAPAGAIPACSGA